MKTWHVIAGFLGAGLVGLAAYAATSATIALGTMDHSELVGGPATIMMRTLTIEPGEVLGWHYHPGAGAYTVVTDGMLTVEDGCGGETLYMSGQAFLEPPLRVHRGKNSTAGQVVTAQTLVVPLGEITSVSTGATTLRRSDRRAGMQGQRLDGVQSSTGFRQSRRLHRVRHHGPLTAPSVLQVTRVMDGAPRQAHDETPWRATSIASSRA